MGKPRSMHGEYTEYPPEMQQAPARPFSGIVSLAKGEGGEEEREKES